MAEGGLQTPVWAGEAETTTPYAGSFDELIQEVGSFPTSPTAITQAAETDTAPPPAKRRRVSTCTRPAGLVATASGQSDQQQTAEDTPLAEKFFLPLEDQLQIVTELWQVRNLGFSIDQLTTHVMLMRRMKLTEVERVAVTAVVSAVVVTDIFLKSKRVKRVQNK